MKQKLKKFFKDDIRTKEGFWFFLASLICVYLFLQLLAGRSNIFKYMSIQKDIYQQKNQQKELEIELKRIQNKVRLLEEKEADFIDELLREKFNSFPKNTYQIKED